MAVCTVAIMVDYTVCISHITVTGTQRGNRVGNVRPPND